MLKALGYAPNPDCPRCDGLGYFVKDVSASHGDFGKALECDAQGCYRDSWQAWKTGTPQLIHRGIQPQQTFENFKKLPGTAQALEAAKAFAGGTSDFIWLLIYGGYGNGKTHLANAVALVLNQRGIDARYFDCGALWAMLRAKIDDGGLESELTIIQDVHALILDDFNPRTDKDHPWESDVIERILQHRYREQLPTMMTSNRDLKELPPRVVSRFNDKSMARCVVNEGKDYRMRKGG